MEAIVVVAVLSMVAVAFYLVGKKITPPASVVYSVETDTSPIYEVEMIVPEKQSTWPSGDRLWNVCQAVALAEGYNLVGSVPARLHNPGDLSDGASTYGSEYHSGSNVTTFPTHEIGWQWLYKKFYNIANSLSRTYGPDPTWRQVAMKYAGNWQPWLSNVTRVLGVDPDSKVSAYVRS